MMAARAETRKKPMFGYCYARQASDSAQGEDDQIVMTAIKRLKRVPRHHAQPYISTYPSDPLPDGRCVFWSLPIELYQMILHYVFAGSPTYALDNFIHFWATVSPRNIVYCRAGNIHPAFELYHEIPELALQPFLRHTAFELGQLCIPRIKDIVPALLGGYAARIRRLNTGLCCGTEIHSSCDLTANVVRLLKCFPSLAELNITTARHDIFDSPTSKPNLATLRWLSFNDYEQVAWLGPLIQHRRLEVNLVYDGEAFACIAKANTRALSFEQRQSMPSFYWQNLRRFAEYQWLKRLFDRAGLPSPEANAEIQCQIDSTESSAGSFSRVTLLGMLREVYFCRGDRSELGRIERWEKSLRRMTRIRREGAQQR